MELSMPLFCFALLVCMPCFSAFRIDRESVCEPRSSYNCKRCNGLKPLKVLSLNAWGNSWFNDEPIPSIDEPYDVNAARAAALEAGNTKPNAAFLGLLAAAPDETLIGFLNPSRKKLERLRNICYYIVNKMPDVVFLQEIWYLKDYNFLKDCLGHRFQLSEFDPECGSASDLVNIWCSGVTTVTRHRILNQRFEPLPSDSNFATAPTLNLWSFYLSSRKVLFNDIEIDDCRIRLVNTHLFPYDTETFQKRELRVEQANFIISALGCHWDFVILGMDMNDFPIENGTKIPPYATFLNDGFQDAANPDQSTHGFGANGQFYYFPTFARPANTWTNPAEPVVTLDYIMAKGQNSHRRIKSEIWVNDFEVKDLRTLDSGASFSDHEALWAEIETRCEKYD